MTCSMARMSNADVQHLTYLAGRKKLLSTADERALATLCLHYEREPFGDHGFGLRMSIRYLISITEQDTMCDKRLLAIAQTLAPIDDTPVPRPYASGWGQDELVN